MYYFRADLLLGIGHSIWRLYPGEDYFSSQNSLVAFSSLCLGPHMISLFHVSVSVGVVLVRVLFRQHVIETSWV